MEIFLLVKPRAPAGLCAWRRAGEALHSGKELSVAKIVVLYNQPADAGAFDRYYARSHVPIAKKLPGLKSFTYAKAAAPDGSPAPYYLVAELTFDSMAALKRAMESEEGRAAAADLPKFAPQGAVVLICDALAA